MVAWLQTKPQVCVTVADKAGTLRGNSSDVRPPHHVDVGPFRYTLTVDKPALNALSIERRKYMAAETDPDALTITVDEGLAVLAERAVVLHETLHAIVSLVGLDDPSGPLGTGDIDEQVIVAVAPALLDVLRRNPDLVAYLTS